MKALSVFDYFMRMETPFSKESDDFLKILRIILTPVNAVVFEKSFKDAYQKIYIDNNFEEYENFIAFRSKHYDFDINNPTLDEEVMGSLTFFETMRNIIDHKGLFICEFCDTKDFNFDSNGNIIETTIDANELLRNVFRTFYETQMKDYNSVNSLLYNFSFEKLIEYYQIVLNTKQ